MNVLIISQCSKRALKETRRILDHFAERKGDRTWHTAITQQGLETLRILLRKSARRNTAIACHWIKSGNRTELLWIIGNRQCFNEAGVVPTNKTARDVLRSHHENLWQTIEDVSLLASIAGLFHDIGKANYLFQKKLKTQQRQPELYRHEWISLCLFGTFVRMNGLHDRQWLEKLAQIDVEDEKLILNQLEQADKKVSPFAGLPPLAKVIGWLIVSHHRLPHSYCDRKKLRELNLKEIERSLINKSLESESDSWCYPYCQEEYKNEKSADQVWKFKYGTPLVSNTWRQKAQQLAKLALQRSELYRDWLEEDPFTVHLARLSLMLADHYYSGETPRLFWQDPNYEDVFANTKEGKLNQQLDEHNIGVSHNAAHIAKTLPVLRRTLPAITHKGFKKRSDSEKFRWQDKAYELACALRERSEQHGFFGVNMASTGCGKTFANGRIMYGLANEKLGCRFSVALGLRTLTLQTGDALRQRLNLAEDDLAVLVGSQAVRELHALNQAGAEISSDHNSKAFWGSESASSFFTEQQYVRYEGALSDDRLGHWLKRSPKSHQLLSAPVLVCTIDHLAPATESERGGRQIVPMLRLLTADLVLDEPDDFDLNDLPALARLVNWAGMLGARVLLSSATLPPALVEGLFNAYRQGRQVYQAAVGEPGTPVHICCAWFDEYGVAQSDHNRADDFLTAHKTFIERRVHHIQQAKPLRLGKPLLIEIDQVASKQEIVKTIAHRLSTAITDLHQAHHEPHPDPRINRKVSIGVLRIANIKQLVAIARELLEITPPINHRFHYCIYHSQHPLAVRSYIEQQLDSVLKDRDTKTTHWWQKTLLASILAKHSEENQVLIVLATPVAEVGRDHDYDWAIVEPSSMRSLIQLAGRVQRHRQRSPEVENMLIWTKNYRALAKDNDGNDGKAGAYWRPGFEYGLFKLKNHDIQNILPIKWLQPVNAVPRIQYQGESMRALIDRPPRFDNLIDLEHAHLEAKLFGCEGMPFNASCWWENHLHWTCALQRLTLFREDDGNKLYILFCEEEEDSPTFYQLDKEGNLIKDSSEFRHVKLMLSEGVEIWPDYEFREVIIKLSEQTGASFEQTCRRFGEIRLPRPSLEEGKWLYEPSLGVFRALG